MTAYLQLSYKLVTLLSTLLNYYKIFLLSKKENAFSDKIKIDVSGKREFSNCCFKGNDTKTHYDQTICGTKNDSKLSRY